MEDRFTVSQIKGCGSEIINMFYFIVRLTILGAKLGNISAATVCLCAEVFLACLRKYFFTYLF